MQTPLVKPAPADAPIAELIAGRWSPRAFDPSRPIEPEKLSSLFEAARWAPSSSNEQPWRYLAFDGRDAEARKRAEACLSEGNVWAKRAPLLLIGATSLTFARNDKPNRFALHDMGAASMALVLQASALGLVAHQMGGFDASLARTSFGIPLGFEVMAMIAVGYPGDLDLLDDRRRERETAPRTRKPQKEFVFFGHWPDPGGERTA